MNYLLMLLLMPQTIEQEKTPQDLLKYKQHKEIPAVIEKNVLKALSYYPQLQNTRIKFVFKQKIKKSVMQAQPVITTLLNKRSNRKYQINISALFKLSHAALPIHQIPDSIMVGWIGHELGHIMDYEHRSALSIVGFGISYLLSSKFIMKAERTADSFAVQQGLGQYIIETKRFILDNAEIPQAYKDRISRLYLSPDIIVEQVRALEEEKIQRDAPLLNEIKF